SRSKKSSNKKKKKSTSKPEGNEHAAKTNGSREGHDPAPEGDTGDLDEPETPTEIAANGVAPGPDDAESQGPKATTNASPAVSTQAPEQRLDHQAGNGTPMPSTGTAPVSKPEVRLEALAKDREALQTEVEQLRQSLQELQRRHDGEVTKLQTQLEESQGEKEQAETQYQNLLGRVNTIKSQLGERLKADRAELGEAKDQIDELEEEKKALQERNETLEADVAKLREEGDQRSKELSSFRNRANLSQQNWSKEREDLVTREAFAREEFEAAKQAMQDWEVLAMEERSMREGLTERLAESEEQLSHQKEAYEKAAAERDNQSLTVDGLQRALQDIQDARKQELRELVESNEAQVDALRKQLQELESRAHESHSAVDATKKELERVRPFEKEVKEKNLLIGKLRHEAVILNDHLTKALRVLKRGKPEDNIDRHIVTNHFLHFLALDRADPKKFQVLQLIAALLNWSDDQREQAGLARPGASNNSLRTPISPFNRTPSSPVLHSDLFANAGGNKESLAELWSGFLEQEAQQGAKDSRSGSISSSSKPS
ncbi:MAG: hypothetical protein M1838_005755, partial [Thelocarpon superellum]